MRVCSSDSRVTCSPNHESVAALLAHVLPASGGYTADAHRKWRERGCDKIEQQFFPMVDWLVSAGRTFDEIEATAERDSELQP